MSSKLTFRYVLLIVWLWTIDAQLNCPVGSFGSECKSKCYCASQTQCDAISGRCDSKGCADGYFGVSCHLKNSAYGAGKAMNGANATNLITDGTPDTCVKVEEIFQWSSKLYAPARIVQLSEGGINGMFEVSTTPPSGGSVKCKFSPQSKSYNCENSASGDELKVLGTRLKDRELCEIRLYQGDECPVGFYGELCDKYCRCADLAVCKSEGKCDQCKPGFTGINCTSVLPGLTQSVDMRIYEEATIEVKWSAWNALRDIGDLPVTSYELTLIGRRSLKPHDLVYEEKVTLNASLCNASCYQKFEDLPRGVTYTATVTVLSGGFRGFSSPHISIRLLEPAPVFNVLANTDDVAEETSSNNGLLAGIVTVLVAIVIVILLVVIIIQIKNKERGGLRGWLNLQIYKARHGESSAMLQQNATPYDYDEDGLEMTPIYVNASRRKPVPLDQLLPYIRQKKASNGFYQEYLEFPVGLHAKATAATETNNIYKNRYRNIIAYDHSRVKLNIAPHSGQTDYINANYIDGCEGPRCYIAVQGPTRSSLDDIWRLSWQVKANVIVMVTNLYEGGRVKCEQYYPDQGQSKDYLGVNVTHASQEVHAHYTIRTFILKKNGESRSLQQFHFTTWPDHGVPVHATALLTFRRRVRAAWLQLQPPPPLVIHCSAGVGRTGTFMAIDTQIEEGIRNSQVDVFNYVQQMRTQRVNMIQTLDQYVFVHDALLEYFSFGCTSIKLKELDVKLDALMRCSPDDGVSPLTEQFKALQELKPVINIESDCQVALHKENYDKNRDCCILPASNTRPVLYTAAPGQTDYINAVYVDMFCRSNGFLVTQSPMPETVVDMWRLVYDYNACAIVTMDDWDISDRTVAQFWPDDYSSKNISPFSIELSSFANEHDLYLVRDLICTHNESHTRQEVRQFQLQRSDGGELGPSQLLKAVYAVHEWYDKGRQVTNTSAVHMDKRSSVPTTPVPPPPHQPVVVHCRNGADRSGLFCALFFALQQVISEGEVDLCQAVNNIRTNRPELVASLDQYTFLHKCARLIPEIKELSE